MKFGIEFLQFDEKRLEAFFEKVAFFGEGGAEAVGDSEGLFLSELGTKPDMAVFFIWAQRQILKKVMDDERWVMAFEGWDGFFFKMFAGAKPDGGVLSVFQIFGSWFEAVRISLGRGDNFD